MKKFLTNTASSFFILLGLLFTVSASAQTLSLNDGNVIQSKMDRIGLNIGSLNYYDNGQILKNLLGAINPGFEPVTNREIWVITAPGTTTTFSEPDIYDTVQANYWQGATFSVVASQTGGAELGCTGTIASNNSPNYPITSSTPWISPIFTVSSPCNGAFTAGDMITLTKTTFPTPNSWYTSNGGDGGFWADPSGGGKFETDTTDLCATCGTQALEMDATASGSAVRADWYFDSPNVDVFVLMNGTFQGSFWAKTASGNPTMTVTAGRLSTGGFNCATYTPAITSTWTQYSFTCTANETATTTQPGSAKFEVLVTGGAAYLDNVSFQKTSGNPNNPTVLRDEVIATIQKYFGNGTPGPSGPFRYWLGQNGETLNNWIAPDYARGPSTGGPGGMIGPAGNAVMVLSLQDYLEICQYLNLQPYFEIPVTFSASEATGLVEFLASPSSTNYGGKRAALGQSEPWTDVFSQIHMSFCNECWNSYAFGGQSLGWRAGDSNQYYDYGVRTAAIFSAIHQDPYYVPSSFDLVMNAQTGVNGGMDAQIALAAPDSIEIEAYTYPLVTSFATDAALWGPAMVEPYERVTSPADPSNFYQSVTDYESQKKCGAYGNAACKVNIYEWGQGTTQGTLDQTHLDYINAGAGEGVIMALQPLLNMQYFGIMPQSFFSLTEYQNGSLIPNTITKLWGNVIDMGGATNNVRPEFLGVQLVNQSIIGPMYSCPINNNVTQNFPASTNGDGGSTPAQNNVPYMYSFCFENGTARSMVLINTDLTNSHTLSFAGTNTPSGAVTQRQFAPTSLDSMNEGHTGSASIGVTATSFIATSTLTNPTSITLPPHSVTALDFTGSLPIASTPVFSPGSGTYTSDQLVTISNSNAGTTIYYTTDGSMPTTSSSVYSGPIAVNANETLQAIAVESNYTNSTVASASYVIVPILATPTFSVASGTYTAAQSVAINEATVGTTIYYTTNGTTPTTSSAVYSGPIAVGANETLKAMASGSGYTNSAVGTATYVIAPVVPVPTFSIAPGTYSGTQIISINEAQAGATVYYAIDGVTPTTAAMVYSGPITVSASETIEAFGVQTGYTNSPIATAVYTISGNASYINIAKGGFAAPSLDLNGGAIVTSGGILKLTDGGISEARSAWNATEVPVGAFVTDFTFQQLNASANGMTFTIQGTGATALGKSGSDLGFGGLGQSVAVKFDLFNSQGEGSDSTGLFTNGTYPTIPSVDLSTTGINLHSGDVMDAHLAYDGTNLTMTLTDTATSAAVVEVFPVNIPSFVGGNTAYVGFTAGTGGLTATQQVLSWSYVATGTSTPTVATPTFNVAAGTYPVAQSVTIADATNGAAIYYTTNGTTPTTSSTLYSGPVAVSASETLEAIAVETGYNNSAVASAAYSITAAPLPAPSFSLAPGVYTTSQSVTISAATPSSSATKATAVKSNAATTGMTVYYTTNGSTPTTASSVYSGPITVSASETLQAIATATGFAPSPVAAAAYTIAPVLPAPVFSVAAGSYATVQSVAISDATAGATIYYTTNGIAPTTSSAVYSGPITVNATETIEAIAVESNYTNSSVATAAYTLTLAPTSYINLASGGFAAGLFNLNGGATVTSTGALQLTDGGGNEARSAWYAAQVPVQNFVTDFTFQQLDANADGMTFTIQGTGAKALGSNGSALGYGGIAKSIAIKFDLHNNAGEGNDSTGIYTNGALPTIPSIDLTSTAINLHSTDIMDAHLVYDGTNLTLTLTDTVTNGSVTEVFPVNIPSLVGASTAWVGFTGGTGGKTATQNVLTWTYTSTAGGTTGAALTAPVFSVSGGAYTSAQTVSIAELTSGATIFYTTNGTIPTTSSTRYTGPITVNKTETLKAIAVKTGRGSSPVATANYTIGATVAVPAISKAGGTYPASQTVTISDSLVGATICFTTDGSTPTAASTQYTGPITLKASETLQAIAVKAGYFNSPVVSAQYTIVTTLAAPTFSVAPGTYASAQTVAIQDASPGALIFYTTNGGIPTASSHRYTGPITVGNTQTIRAIAAETSFTPSAVATATYTIGTAAPAPTFSVVAGAYTATQTVTLRDSVAGLNIYFTTNGTAPTTSSFRYTGPITVSATETVKAIAAGTGYLPSAVAASTYTIEVPAEVPVLSVAAGTYAGAQTVSVTDATAGATLYYTLNGTTPTASSTKYTAPLKVSATETLRVIAIASGKTASAVATATYTIETPALAPESSVASGTYSAAQVVTLTGKTPGTVIYYTTDGTMPKTSSTRYTAPIHVTKTETIRWMAIAAGHTESAVTSATYSIQTVAK